MRVRVRLWLIAGLLVGAVVLAQTAAPTGKIVDLTSGSLYRGKDLESEDQFTVLSPPKGLLRCAPL